MENNINQNDTKLIDNDKTKINQLIWEITEEVECKCDPNSHEQNKIVK